MEAETKRLFVKYLDSIAQQYDPYNAMSYIQVFPLIDAEKKVQFAQNFSKIGRNIFIGSLLGIATSITASRYNFMGILEKRALVRLPMRVLLFLAPHTLFMYSSVAALDSNKQIIQTLDMNIKKFKLTGNPHVLDPQGSLYREFVQMYAGPK